MDIIVFGQLKEMLGSERITVNDVEDIYELQKALHTKYPLLEHAKYKIAVDRKMISDNIKLNNDSEIAMLPPFSGG
ncbi:MAG TPA: MoaD/ThiS family protein [Puia sp.]|nr:MoaD/ThiS family protein [Puia sp.]